MNIMNKKMNNSRSFRVIVLSCLFFGLMHVVKAQDEIMVSPLTAQQFEHCEGDQFYVHFSRYAIMTHWDAYVFSALQHNNPVKSIKTKYYEERMIYDEPTMVEDKEKACTFDYNGSFFISKKNHGQRVWESDGIGHWFRNEAYDISEMKDSFVFEANHQNKRGGITYNRDEKNRVKRVICSWGSGTIIDYTYWANTDYIHTIKRYDATDGKMTAEVKYDYLTTSKQLLLKEATYKTYRRSNLQKTYTYRLNYNASMDVNRVDLFFEDQGDFKEKVEESIDVKIERDKKGNITKCACSLVKYVNNNVDELRKGYVRNASWQFIYDSNNNWTTMTKTQNFNGTKTKQQINRELVYNTSQGTNSKTNTKSQSSSSNSSKKVYSNANDGFVNIRQTPQSKAPVLGVLKNGPEGAILLGTEGDWKKIDCNGIVGYVYERYIQDTPTEVFKDTAAKTASQNTKTNTNQLTGQPAKEYDGEVYQIVEQMPEFPGGDQKLMEYISNNIRYPQVAREKGIQGRVFVGFIVEPDGNISNVKTTQSIGGGCDEEAVRVVKSMPKWKPGKQKGQAVRVGYQIPISFRLTSSSNN